MTKEEVVARRLATIARVREQFMQRDHSVLLKGRMLFLKKMLAACRQEGFDFTPWHVAAVTSTLNVRLPLNIGDEVLDAIISLGVDCAMRSLVLSLPLMLEEIGSNDESVRRQLTDDMLEMTIARSSIYLMDDDGVDDVDGLPDSASSGGN